MLFTSESVTEGHPDKVCDQISDAILDEILSQDKNARVAVECVATTGLVHVVGELNTTAYVEIPQVVREVLEKIGYTSSEIGFDAHSCGVLVSIGSQSPDISQGVDKKVDQEFAGDISDRYDALGAGDQGIMFGYATDETPELFPLPALLANKIAQRLAEVRHLNIVNSLRPDGKTQVTVKYDDNGTPIGIDTVLISTQHDEDVDQIYLKEQLKTSVIDFVLKRVLEGLNYPLDIDNYNLLVNPTGKFVIGGPQGDAGLTGRKIIVDTYGGSARHGGGCFSGKDPSKVDRSAAYALRWVAKNIVAAKLAKRVELQVAYAIGVSAPVGLYINTFGTGKYSDNQIIDAVKKVFDLRPASIIEQLNLLEPNYKRTAAYGHFGRDEFSWEKTNKTDELIKELSVI